MSRRRRFRDPKTQLIAIAIFVALLLVFRDFGKVMAIVRVANGLMFVVMLAVIVVVVVRTLRRRSM